MSSSPLVGWVSPAGRVLLLVLLTATVATLRAPQPKSLLACLALLFVVVALARPNVTRLLRRALVGLGVVGMFMVPLLLAGDGARAALLGGRSLLALAVALSLADTLLVAEVGPALAALGVPCKLASVIAAAVAQVGLLRETGERIALARRLRGARGASVGPDIVAALLVRSSERAERMSLAADLRGRDIRRTARRCRLGLRDAVVLAPALASALLLHVAV